MYGGIFIDGFIANFPLGLTVTHTHTHTHTHNRFMAFFQVSRCQKTKTVSGLYGAREDNMRQTY